MTEKSKFCSKCKKVTTHELHVFISNSTIEKCCKCGKQTHYRDGKEVQDEPQKPWYGTARSGNR